jgi:hypothetical protein
VYWSALAVGEVEIGVVTVMSTVPALPAGLTAVIEVEELTVKLVAGVVPNMTAVASARRRPAIATVVPPATGPEVGLTAVTAGAPSYVYWSGVVADDVPTGLVTSTSKTPAECPGLTAVIDVLETTV